MKLLDGRRTEGGSTWFAGVGGGGVISRTQMEKHPMKICISWPGLAREYTDMPLYIAGIKSVWQERGRIVLFSWK